jgi:alpha-L-fucosidase 2
VPRNWAEVSFEDLRAEGGHRVSARREGGATVWFRVVVGRDGAVRIRDNFGGRQPHWNRDGVAKVGQDFLLDLKAGQTLEAKVE